uniref:Uncharacterized protein n=1 Tax=Anopheles albimanus TaxID=7167 RepID=A0A182FK24_ANOAL
MYHWQLNRERGTVPRAVGNTDIVYRMVYGSFNRRMAPRHRRNENDDFEDDSINGLAFSADGNALGGKLIYGCIRKAKEEEEKEEEEEEEED